MVLASADMLVWDCSSGCDGVSGGGVNGLFERCRGG